jgi:hypothetical protein
MEKPYDINIIVIGAAEAAAWNWKERARVP